MFRIWIVACTAWQPRSWRDLPRQAVALEPAEAGCYDAEETLAYLEGHNATALAQQEHRWAVAVPVAIVYEGEPTQGETIFPRQIGLPRRETDSRRAGTA